MMKKLLLVSMLFLLVGAHAHATITPGAVGCVGPDGARVCNQNVVCDADPCSVTLTASASATCTPDPGAGFTVTLTATQTGALPSCTWNVQEQTVSQAFTIDSSAGLPVEVQSFVIATANVENTIRWTTASEVDNFGYNVYRGLTKSGPFVLVTSKPVLGAGTVDVPRSYKYEDDTITSGVAYCYYVESISMDGVREQATPVSCTKPK
jgi:hypothetical protein